VEPLVLDVTNDESVRAAIEFVCDKAGRLDIVVNNAGATLIGARSRTRFWLVWPIAVGVELAQLPAQAAPTIDQPALQAVFDHAAQLPRLHALVVARQGAIVAEARFRGPSLDAPVNIKSISKSIVSALVGIAIHAGKLEGVEQRIAPFFARYLRRYPDPGLRQITIGHLLSMRSGLARTSGPSYGPWVRSRDWVGHILSQPMSGPPGGAMNYSTGNTHLLSAILTKATSMSTYAYARKHLAAPLGLRLAAWPRDPQGIYFGGNQMRLSAHALLRFGELYRNAGRAGARQVLPEAWVRESLTPRARSPYSYELYGYGWFISKVGDHAMYYAWGYGGQFIFVVPDVALTVVTTSAVDGPRDMVHIGAIHDLLRAIVAAAVRS
jgi:CubicO group peptidase (beta-lactamase class C family)